MRGGSLRLPSAAPLRANWSFDCRRCDSVEISAPHRSRRSRSSWESEGEERKNAAGGGLVAGKRNGNHLVVGSDEPRDAATVSDVDAGENAVHKGDAHRRGAAEGLDETRRRMLRHRGRWKNAARA